MIRQVLYLHRKVIRLRNYLVNRFIFLFRNTEYKEFPIINGIIKIHGSGRLIFGSNVKINSGFKYNPVGLSQSCSIHISDNAQVTLGNNVGISNSLIYSVEGVVIEDNVLVGGGCQILDNDFHSINYLERIKVKKEVVQSKPILIQEGAFIGASSIILKGVTIGKHSIIGSGSVVSKSIPSNQIWAGNPIKFIKEHK